MNEIVDFSETSKIKKGIKNFLGDLEAEVMEVIWDLESCSVRDVHENLCQKKEIAYTTVMTIMARLADKKILKKKMVKKAYYYQPRYDREKFVEVCVGGIIEGVAGKYTQPVLTCFVDKIAELDPDSLEELERLIDKKKSDNK